MEPLEVVARRLHAQRLTGEPHATAAEAVAWSGAVQAQVPVEARWSLGMRVAGATDASIQAACDRGEVLRTHVLRPTWHYVAAHDLAWIQRLTAPRVHALNAYHYRQSGLDGPALAQVHRTLERVLAGGEPLMRRELSAALGLSGVPLAMALVHAELELLIVSGPMRGKQQTHVLAGGRVPPPPARSREDDLAELARRYAQSHAAATPQDFAWWSSLPVSEATAALDAAGDAAPETAPPEPPGALLLPTFDESVVAFRSRRYVLADGTATDELLTRAVLVHGRVAGTWRRSGARVEVDVEAARDAAARLEAFSAAVYRAPTRR